MNKKHLLFRFLFVAVISYGFSTGASAHPMAPSLLKLQQQPDSVLEVYWKQPLRQGDRVALEPILPESCRKTDRSKQRIEATALVSTSHYHCKGGVAGKAISIANLEASNTYVLLEFIDENGFYTSNVLSSDSNRYIVAGSLSLASSLMDYSKAGFDHLMMGPDHILFVLGLLILLRDRFKALVIAFSCFTVGHTVSLGVAWYGDILLPAALTEILIVISLLWMAWEVVNKSCPGIWLSIRTQPYLLTLVFGLVHGSGFAGNLLASLHKTPHTLMSIAAFNLGIELGQLLVVLVAGISLYLFRYKVQFWQIGDQLAGYLMGGISVYWLLKLATF